MRIKALSLFVALSIPAAAPALADSRVKAKTPTAQVIAVDGKGSGVERILASALTLQQALAKPDATKLVHPDGKESTVGELRKRAKAREILLATKPLAFGTGGPIKMASLRGTTQKKSFVDIAKEESAAAIALRTPKTTHHGPNYKPTVGIGLVNGKLHDFVLSPGGNVTIVGGEFGDTMGQVNVIGQFPGMAAALKVVDWRGDEIYAIFPTGVRGVPDHDVSLQVITSAGKTFRLAGGKFIATREDQVVMKNIPSLVRFESAGNWPASMGDSGQVHRWQAGDSIACKSPSADRLIVLDPGRGFSFANFKMWYGRTDSGMGSASGEDGSRTFYPEYAFGNWQGNTIDMRWGVWRDHESPYLALPGYDTCLSDYTIAVILSGPAGVAF